MFFMFHLKNHSLLITNVFIGSLADVFILFNLVNKYASNPAEFFKFFISADNGR